MNILSCFDGISCGQVALNRLGMKYDNYFASEINKDAMAVTQYNYPNTIQLGNILNIDLSTLPKIDLLFGGFPCQSFSFSGKGLNFEDERGKLFFRLAEIIKYLKPKYFLLENVIMKKQYQDIISKEIGTDPIIINSSSFSAQNRKRLYWTNIPNIENIEDNNIDIDSILDLKSENIYCGAMRGRYLVNGKRQDMKMKTKGLTKQRIEVRFDKKTNTLTTTEKDNIWIINPKEKYYWPGEIETKRISVNEYEKLQTLPIDYTLLGEFPNNIIKEISKSSRYKLIGNGWTVDVISHILKNV